MRTSRLVAAMVAALAACSGSDDVAKTEEAAPPGAVTGVTAEAGDAQVTITWSAVDGATSYRIYWSSSSGVTKATGWAIDGATSPYVHEGLTNGDTYHYVVTAVGAGGEGAESSEASARPLPPLPGAPANASATASAGQVVVSWDAVAGATSYTLYWSNAPGVTETSGTAIANVTSPYTHASLVPGETYHYVVTASNLAGEGAASTAASGTVPASTPTVLPLYATNGAKWNDYVEDDGATRRSATDVACDKAVATGGYGSCIHGGEMRAVDVLGRTTCADLFATDALGAFTWVCDASTTPVRMISVGLAPGKRLADLVDFTAGGWKENAVTVKKNATVTVAQSAPSATWWGNGITVLGSSAGASLTAAGEIYLVKTDPSNDLTIAADGIALVIAPAIELVAAAAGTAALTASSRAFLWIEGRFDANGRDAALNLSGLRYSVLKGIQAERATLSTSTSAAVRVGGANVLVDDVVAARSTIGVHANGLESSTLRLVRAFDNASTGIRLQGARNSVLTLATAASNGGSGLVLEGASGSGDSAVVLGLTATLNAASGALVQNVSRVDVASAVAMNNSTTTSTHGFLLSNVTGSAFTNLASANNNRAGLALSTVADAVFGGQLLVGNNGSGDCLVVGGSSPGLEQGASDECVAPTGSTVVVTSGVSLAASFLGKVTSADAVAGGPTSASPTTWTAFENAARGWGKDSSLVTDAGARGDCSGGTCRIWDWSLGASDTRLRAFGGFSSIVRSHVWGLAASPASQADCDAFAPDLVYAANVCSSAFVATATELLGDGLGNENGLCEAGEGCLELIDVGAYQGHGALSQTGAVTVGSGTATMYRYATNGR